MTALPGWFEVDKEGLARTLSGRDKVFLLYELISNAWDALKRGGGTVRVYLRPVPRKAQVEVVVEDDSPTGFDDLSHAFTMFAESAKKVDPEQRGQFDIGEKWVLALCTEAEIASTTGTITFDEKGRRESKKCLPRGSRFRGLVRMTHAEGREIQAKLYHLIPPVGIKTFINGEPLPDAAPVPEAMIPERTPIATFEATLRTSISDGDGIMRPTVRKTTVSVYEPLPGEEPHLYEMGIPVVETHDKWHIDIAQKVPLNMQRDNVTPSYLRDVRVLVVNHLATKLTPADANSTWVRDAASNDKCAPEAITHLLDVRFGRNRVAFDPSDPEANHRAASEGHTVVHGGMLSGGEWANAKAAGAIQPAGQVFPTPKPYSPGGEPLNLVPPDKWTLGMCEIVRYAKVLARHLIGCRITVSIANEVGWGFGATYGGAVLTLNLGRLGHRFFDNGITEDVDDLLLHEFGHHFCGDHLDENYYRALTRLGAKLRRLPPVEVLMDESFA